MKGFPWPLLADLRCPCCGARFETAHQVEVTSDGLRDGVLRCDCYEYPVVQGIPVLRQISPVSSTHNGAVDHLRRGDAQGALLWLLANGSAPGVPGLTDLSEYYHNAIPLAQKIRNLFRGESTVSDEKRFLQIQGLEALLQASRPRGYASYLFHRFANPSFLGAIPPLVVLGDDCRSGKRRRLLDLLCGIGHSSATLNALCPDMEVIMADVDFVNLYIARHCMAPDVSALCLDAELPLPFSDKSLDDIFCMDGLHYVKSKVALLKQVDRVVSTEGAWLFAHMHNSTVDNVNPGAPLDAQGYAQRFAFGQQRLLPEGEVLRQFQEEGCLDLISQPPVSSLDSSNALILMGTRKEHLWRRYDGLDTALDRRPDLLALNPLYRLEKAADGLIARASWPSEALRRECTATTPIFRDTVHLSPRTVHEICAAQTGETASDEVRELMRLFMVVPLPTCYPRTNLLLH